MPDAFSQVTSRSFIIKRGLWDSTPRALLLHRDYVEFDDQSLRDEHPTRFLKEDIRGYRFGVVFLYGFKFCIGRQYLIYIRDKNGKELKIDFRSYYGIRKEILSEKYLEIVNTVTKLYFSEIINGFLDTFSSGQLIRLCGVELTRDAVILEHKGLFRNSRITIAWDDVRTRMYRTYYAIYSSMNPADINKSYRYLEDDNA